MDFALMVYTQRQQRTAEGAFFAYCLLYLARFFFAAKVRGHEGSRRVDNCNENNEAQGCGRIKDLDI